MEEPEWDIYESVTLRTKCARDRVKIREHWSQTPKLRTEGRGASETRWEIAPRKSSWSDSIYCTYWLVLVFRRVAAQLRLLFALLRKSPVPLP